MAKECRRDIALLSTSLIASVENTLSNASGDLELVARAASVVSIQVKAVPSVCANTVFSLLLGPPSPTAEQTVVSLKTISQVFDNLQLSALLLSRTSNCGIGAYNCSAVYAFANLQ